MGHKRRHFIRQWRKHRAKTQDQLSEMTGISRSYLSKIEGGKRDYDETMLELIANALMCEPVDLIMRDPAQPELIWTIWDTLTPVQRQQVTAMAEVIKKTGTGG